MNRCVACLADLPEGSRYCPSCATPVEDPTSVPTETSAGSMPASPPSGKRSRFIPGTMLAQRYRVVGMVGRGGMGEVYHAEDLKLGQPVALKFLPPEVERDRDRLSRFLNEVKLARQISHPAVCRVYDVGEVNGQHYLSMEYVDGEDLASLLRRIGHLPKEKAVEMARQLCAGLAAAHEQGILHRDLKPANVMIDGRGRAKITDFGLAALAENITDQDVRSGTPTYMAPEQLDGKAVSVRSDLYALGLVLYELFTGKRAFDAPTASELRRLQIESTPTSPSSFVAGFDPAVERVIFQCLEKRPEDRPPSALAVAAALPGGDPLAAALAAGETPSPEMVAAAGPRGGLRPGAAMVCLAAVIVATVVGSVIGDPVSPYRYVPLNKSIEALRDDAREIAERLGYDEHVEDRVAYFEYDFREFQEIARGKTANESRELLAEPGQLVMRLFYRQASRQLAPDNLGGFVEPDDPPRRPGDLSLRLDLQGHLSFLEAIPPRKDDPEQAGTETDWATVLDAAGLDPASFEPADPTVAPSVYADERRAWTGVLPDNADRPVRVEAAALHGRPVYFEKIVSSHRYWTTGEDEQDDDSVLPPWAEAAFWVFLALFLLIIGGAIFVAVRNLMLGRGDRKGAFRIAMAVFCLRMLQWLLTGHHVPAIDEIVLAVIALSGALALALLAWLFYIAVEPYMRRLWPEALVAWNRLLAGRWRDPLIGRDILLSLGLGFGVGIVLQLVLRFADAAGFVPLLPHFPFDPLRGSRYAVGELFSAVLIALPVALGLMVVVLLVRLVVRRTWIAAAVCSVLWGLWSCLQFGVVFGNMSPGAMLIGFVLGSIYVAVMMFVLLRFGLVAMVAYLVAASLFDGFPITADPSALYFATGMLAPLAIFALALVAFRISLAGRPLFKDEFQPQT